MEINNKKGFRSLSTFDGQRSLYSLGRINVGIENAGTTMKPNECQLNDLKATIAGVFATSGTDNGLRDLIDDVAKAIRNFDFSSIKETFSNIGLFIQGVWEQPFGKALFNNFVGAVILQAGTSRFLQTSFIRI